MRTWSIHLSSGEVVTVDNEAAVSEVHAALRRETVPATIAIVDFTKRAWDIVPGHIVAISD